MSDTLLEFPCRFPIKIMGQNNPEFAPTMLEVIKTHVADFSEQDMVIRASSGNNYVALTVSVNVNTKIQLDALYQALTQHTMVKMVL